MPGQEYTEAASADYAVPGGPVTPCTQEGDNNVGVNTLVAVANSSRARLIVAANGGDAWLGYGDEAVLNQGIYLSGGVPGQNGGPLFIEEDWKGPVYVISEDINCVVSWMETSYNAGDDEGEDNAGAEEFVPSGPSDWNPQTDVPEFEPEGE